jgi:uncharacterized protein (TIGR00106 family)
VLAEFSIMPVGKGESLSKDIAQVIGVIDESGLPYDFGPMGTTVEGEWDEVMALIKKGRDKLLQTSNRIYITIRIDERKGAKDKIIGKVKSVEDKLGKHLRR